MMRIRRYTWLLAAISLAGCVEPSTDEPWTSKQPGGETSDDIPQPADVEFVVVESEDEVVPAESEAEPVIVAKTPGPAPGRDAYSRAVNRLVRALDDPNALLRANAIEGLSPVPERIEWATRRGLTDENRGVRFVAAMTVGELRLESVVGDVEPLLEDPSGSVRAAAIYAMRRNGLEANPTPLARMLKSHDAEIKGNAAMVLGDLGEPSAITMLELAMGHGLDRVSVDRARIVDMQIAEALVKLGSERHLEGIRAALFAPAEQGELTALACQICGRLKDERVIPTLMNLAYRPPPTQAPAEVRMAAVMALAQTDPSRAGPEVPLEYADHEVPGIRALAVMTLSYIDCTESRVTVAIKLDDPDPLVQVSAAAAILQLDR